MDHVVREWGTLILALVTSIGLVALRIDQWVHRRQSSETGVEARLAELERARLERQEHAEKLRAERERAVTHRLDGLDRDWHELEGRVAGHGARLRMVEGNQLEALVRLRQIEGHLWQRDARKGEP